MRASRSRSTEQSHEAQRKEEFDKHKGRKYICNIAASSPGLKPSKSTINASAPRSAHQDKHHYLLNMILLAKSSGRQSRERGCSGRFETGAGQVVDEAAHVDCGGQSHGLEVGFGEAEVTGGPHFKGAYAL